MPPNFQGIPPAPSVLLFGLEASKMRLLERVLEEGGCRCLEATSLSEATRLLREHMFEGAVLQSLRPRDDASLLAATVLLRYRGSRVVVLTDWRDEVAEKTLLGVGVSAVLPAAAPLEEVRDLLLRGGEPEGPRLTHYGVVPPRQLEALEALVAKDPESPDTQWLLGFAYYRAGRFLQAVELLGKIQAQDGGHAQALYYLGSCHFQLGDPWKAAHYWRLALDADERGPLARRAREHLERLPATVTSTVPGPERR